jgi:hypothetical protein
VSDFWIALQAEQQLEVYRSPKDGVYPPPTILRAGDSVAPLVAPQLTIPVEKLLLA